MQLIKKWKQAFIKRFLHLKNTILENMFWKMEQPVLWGNLKTNPQVQRRVLTEVSAKNMRENLGRQQQKNVILVIHLLQHHKEEL